MKNHILLQETEYYIQQANIKAAADVSLLHSLSLGFSLALCVPYCLAMVSVSAYSLAIASLCAIDVCTQIIIYSLALHPNNGVNSIYLFYENRKTVEREWIASGKTKRKLYRHNKNPLKPILCQQKFNHHSLP